MKIYTISDKRPDFILKQKKSFDAFLLDDFEYIVVNNGSSQSLRDEIHNICLENNIRQIYVENPRYDNILFAICIPLDQILSKYIKLDKETDISVVIDSDMFFVNKFSIKEYTEDNEIVGVKQLRGDVGYIWNGIFFINHKTIRNIEELDFTASAINGVQTDIGGNTYFYFKNNPLCKLKDIPHTSHINRQNNNLHCLPTELSSIYEDEYCFELLANCILHYGSGSNWKNQSAEYHFRKTSALDKILELCYLHKPSWNTNNYAYTENVW